MWHRILDFLALVAIVIAGWVAYRGCIGEPMW